MKSKHFFEKTQHSSRKSLKNFCTKPHPETGRSMVEMLGVLALMGFLSIGSFFFLRYAFDFWHAREIQDVISQSKILAVTKKASGEEKLKAFFRKTSLNGYDVRVQLDEYPDEPSIYTIILTKVSLGIQRFVWANRAHYAKMNILVQPSTDVEETPPDASDWADWGMDENVAQRFQSKGKMTTTTQLGFVFEALNRNRGRGGAGCNPLEDPHCGGKNTEMDCHGQPLPYEHGNICPDNQYWDFTLNRCENCTITTPEPEPEPDEPEVCEYPCSLNAGGECVCPDVSTTSCTGNCPANKPWFHDGECYKCPSGTPHFNAETCQCEASCTGNQFEGALGICYSCENERSIYLGEEASEKCTCENREYVNGYCVLKCGANEYRDKDGYCHACDACESYKANDTEAGSLSNCTTACGSNRIIEDGWCVLSLEALQSRNQYMSADRECFSCDGCNGYKIGNSTSSHAYRSCINCVSTKRKQGGWNNYYCITETNKFGWMDRSTFICKSCADLKAGGSHDTGYTGMNSLFMAQADCEAEECGLWEKAGSRNYCCPKNTFYSARNSKCWDCDIERDMRMSNDSDAENCEAFCGDQRALIDRGGAKYCVLKTQCTSDQIYDKDDNACYECDNPKLAIYIGTDAAEKCTCENREYVNGYCVLKCDENEYRDKNGVCHACDACEAYEANDTEAGSISTCTTACSSTRTIEHGKCVLPLEALQSTNQYMSIDGTCHSCDECDGYKIGNGTSSYYYQSCTNCVSTKRKQGGWNNYYCIRETNKFGWKEDDTFICKSCADLKADDGGLSGLAYPYGGYPGKSSVYITQEDCEAEECGLWEKDGSRNRCCPKNTFYSYHDSSCFDCDYEEDVKMNDAYDSQNCETFCGDQRVLINRGGTKFCVRKSTCSTDEMYDIDNNECYSCENAPVSVHLGEEASEKCTCENREYVNGYCVLKCGANEYRDKNGVCHACDACEAHEANDTETGSISTCITACGSTRIIEDGKCVLPLATLQSTNQYMSADGTCHSCDECDGYKIGNSTSSYAYQSCISCVSTSRKQGGYGQNYCIQGEEDTTTNKFGWEEDDTFICKSCAELKAGSHDTGYAGKSSLFMTQADCEAEECGLWEKRTDNQNYCCPKETFYSHKDGKCWACDIPTDIQMKDIYDSFNCEIFCDTTRVLITRDHKNYCVLKNDCGEGEIYRKTDNTCYTCEELTELQRFEIKDVTDEEACRTCPGFRFETNATYKTYCVAGRCSDESSNSRFIGADLFCYNCTVSEPIPILDDESKEECTQCGRSILTVEEQLVCAPKCINGEVRQPDGSCTFCPVPNSRVAIADTEESRTLCTECSDGKGQVQEEEGQVFCYMPAE